MEQAWRGRNKSAEVINRLVNSVQKPAPEPSNYPSFEAKQFTKSILDVTTNRFIVTSYPDSNTIQLNVGCHETSRRQRIQVWDFTNYFVADRFQSSVGEHGAGRFSAAVGPDLFPSLKPVFRQPAIVN
jgi:hypothetical protein